MKQSYFIKSIIRKNSNILEFNTDLYDSKEYMEEIVTEDGLIL